MAKRVKRHATKTEETEEFYPFFERSREVFAAHRRLISGGLVIVCLIIVGVVLWTRHVERQERRASFLLYQGMIALKEADGLTGDEARKGYDKALNILKKVAETHGSTKNGELGLFFVGKCLARLKRYDEAIQHYEAFLSENEKNPLYRALAKQSLGFAYESRKDYEKALVCFKEVAAMDRSFLREEATLAVARIHEAMGQKREALDAYREYLTNHPDSVETSHIRRRVALLENQL
jgi:tetratricopeptide (TPR) repeat protein